MYIYKTDFPFSFIYMQYQCINSSNPSKLLHRWFMKLFVWYLSHHSCFERQKKMSMWMVSNSVLDFISGIWVQFMIHFFSLMNYICTWTENLIYMAWIPNYIIPKGWKVLAWFRSVHFDSEVYENPLEFNPGRWNVSCLEFTTDNFNVYVGLHIYVQIAFAGIEL